MTWAYCRWSRHVEEVIEDEAPEAPEGEEGEAVKKVKWPKAMLAESEGEASDESKLVAWLR